MNFNVKLAAAIAAALGSGAAMAQSGVPTLAAIEAAYTAGTTNVYIAGSSAAKNGVLTDIETNVCGGAGNYYLFQSGGAGGNKNFFAISCTPVAAVNAANAGVYNIFYRDEGGSVSGMLPIVNGINVNELALTAATITANACAAASPCTINVTGESTTNGADDSFGPAGTLAKSVVDLGISDVEPAALIGQNYPVGYSTTVWGPVNQTGLVNLSGQQLFGEVYALFVNENSALFNQNPLNISLQTAADIMQHKLTNWSLVPTIVTGGGGLAASASLPITIVNREKGSGSRTATDLLIAGDVCRTGGAPLFDKANAVDYFSTSDLLAAANTVAGAITYATIDQSAANLVQVTISSNAPANTGAASGAYPFWVEATYVVNPASAADPAVIDYITSVLQTEATAPHVADVLAIPGIPSGAGANAAHANWFANTASTVAALGPATIYTNPFSRGGVTCNDPTDVATAP
jgi:hypothetical protein